MLGFFYFFSLKDNLLKRGVVKEVNCIFYSNNTEIGEHILWDCPSVMDV
jgi:hypothetical protein